MHLGRFGRLIVVHSGMTVSSPRDRRLEVEVANQGLNNRLRLMMKVDAQTFGGFDSVRSCVHKYRILRHGFMTDCSTAARFVICHKL